MIDDPVIIKNAIKYVTDNYSAEYSIKMALDEAIITMNSIDDEYISLRALDYEDIKTRLIHIIQGENFLDFSNINEEVILVSDDISPSVLSSIDTKYIKGIILEKGGAKSHTALIADALNIPLIVRFEKARELIDENHLAIIDANERSIIIDPTDEILEDYKNKIARHNLKITKLKKLIQVNPKTVDGKKIGVLANIGNDLDLKNAIYNGANGVGLFRTEFLYMNMSSFPSEEFQFNTYRRTAKKLGEKPLTIRTLDIGGDKPLSYYKFKKEDNPFLGLRAIRFSLLEKDIFKIQLRAILRASIYGDIKIMLPLISQVEEVYLVKNILKECMNELDKQKISYSPNIEIGIMSETPSSVFLAKDLLKIVDFISIGTNDLNQYTLALDRGNDTIIDFYSDINPSILRCIKILIDESHRFNKQISMCGALAGNLKVTKLLLGLGLDNFSVVPSKILEVKKIIEETDINLIKEKSISVINESTNKELLDKLKEL